MVTRREETRALMRLVNEMDATVLVNLKQRFPRGVRERVEHRIDAEDRARDTHTLGWGMGDGCTLNAEPDHDPIMPTWSPAKLGPEGRCAVLFPCPTLKDWAKGELGWGRGERFLADHLRQCGLPRDRVTWIPIVGCAPADASGQERPITEAERAWWRPHVLEYLDAADVRYVLLHGTAAVRAWRPDAKVTESAGVWGVMEREWVVMPVPHALATMRPDGLPITEWSRWITQFAQYVTEDGGLTGLGTSCTKCGSTLFAYDADGLALCEEHFEKFRDRRDKLKVKHDKQTQTKNQGTML